MDSRRAAVAVALLALTLGVLHLVMAGALELSPDEAYYWSWAQAPALAYPDHPPLCAWLVALGTAVGGDTALGVRWPFVLLGTLLVPLVFVAGRRAGLRPGLALLAAAAAGTSLLGSAAALLATPDTPLAFGWAVGLVGLLGAAGVRPSRLDWPLVAAGIAVACWSKLTGVLLPVVVAAWLVRPAGAGWRRRPQPWLALAAGPAAAAPTFWADAAGGGATGFQLAHGLWSPGLSFLERVGNLGAYVGAQLGLLTPLLAVGVVVFLVRPRLGEPSRAAVWWSALLPWAAFLLAAPLAAPEANWPGVAHLGGLLGAALAVQEAQRRGARWSRTGWVAAALALAVAVSAAVHVHLARPCLPLDRSGGEPFVGSTDPAARLHGWEALVRALERQGDAVCPGWYGAVALLRFHRFRGSVAPGCAGGIAGGGRGRGEPRPAPGVALWLEPSAGLGLPGGFAVRAPGNCVELPPGPASWDPGLARPAAPVRLRRLRCP
ncbi:MAG: glycosyltransferase family 39 protein [Deltaproteobacteria bacterium]|nr:glycosyltransferase family 39 protein [Deltaproteobacteria bacterium]